MGWVERSEPQHSNFGRRDVGLGFVLLLAVLTYAALQHGRLSTPMLVGLAAVAGLLAELTGVI